VIFGFGKKSSKAEEPDEDEEEIEYVLFQGATNGKDANLEDNKKLVAAGLTAAKELVTEALSERSDSFRMEPQGERAVVTFSIDGIRRPGPKFPVQKANAITQMLKLLAGLDIAIKDKPQVGGIKATYKDLKWEIIVKSTPIKGGEQLTVMYRNLKIVRAKPDDIGAPDIVKKTIRDYAAKKNGVILFAGPPESGVTTQALALLRSVDVYLYQCFILGDMGTREVVNVPIFKPEPGHGLDQTIDRIKRNDGDLIYFVSLNDEEIAKVAFNRGGDIGIVSEFTAKDAADGIIRMIDKVGDRKLVCDQLKCIVSHKLIRKLCNKCKEAFRPSPKLLAQTGLPEETEKLYRKAPEPEPDPKTQELPEPCSSCNDDCFRGRAAIFEMITMSDGLREVIMGGGDADAIRALAKKEKMLTFQIDALRLVADGTTGLEELQRVFKPAVPAGAKKAVAKKAPPPKGK
jgi:type II secretory ATPase GspE/PulE/Tfp pilus assembly ATPase PilB-like protein